MSWRTRLFPTHAAKPRNRVGRIWRGVLYLVRKALREDGVGGLGASLALQTLLSIVPLVGVALALVTALGGAGAQVLLVRLTAALAPPYHVIEAIDFVVGLARNVSLDRLGVIGFAAAVVLGYLIAGTLQQALDRIWRFEATRNFAVRFLLFYAVVIAGPLVLVYGLAQPIVVRAGGEVLLHPAVTSLAGMLLIQWLAPSGRVRLRAALAGALASATAFELGKHAFGGYLSGFSLTTYEGLYGPLALLPIFVLWIYVSWLIVLVGAEIAFVVQNAEDIAAEGYVNRYLVTRHAGAMSPRLATKTLLRIAQGATDRASLRAGLGLSRDQTRSILEELALGGFVTHAAGHYALARPAAEISIAQISAHFAGRSRHEAPDLSEVDRLFAPATELGDYSLAALAGAVAGGPDDEVNR